ncbi:hypothetical protein [Ancylobacter terrae]|uniref:hypothetical protein n=1 Tax=Ancylobacter sp. sgz301288 TaxID=3342077 RepID=UPI00385F15AD
MWINRMRPYGWLPVVVLLLGCALARPALAQCPGAQALPDYQGKPIKLLENTLLFRTDILQHDVDGSPRAYGVRDQGTEFVCNGLAPIRPAHCARSSNRGAECARACREAFARWSRSGLPPQRLNDTMVSIGLGGGSSSRIAARLQPPPNEAWFVSETSVKLAPPAGPVTPGWIDRQEAQLDPGAIRYFVIPGRFRAAAWDATPGDAGYVLDAATGIGSYFIIGDTGGALDEGSTALLTALRNGAAPPMGQDTSALGETVQRYTAGIRGDFRVAIFRHSSTSDPRQRTQLTLKQGEVEGWSRGVAEARLAALGGNQRLLDCTKP